MKAKHLLFILILNCVKLFSQSWCTPNMVFYRDYHVAFSGMGYIKYVYSGTITINNLTCQNIFTESKYYSPFFVGVVTPTNNIITHYSNGVVTKYFQATNSFDTIYNFNANIGDKWSLSPKSYTNCAKSRVEVMATGTQVIQGVTLKWLKVTISGYSVYNNSPAFYADTIFERMGSKKYDFFEAYDLCPYASDGISGGKIRCYNDDQIINYTTSTVACNYFYTPPTAINTNILKVDDVSIYPNPATTYFTIDLNTNINTAIEITNLTGQILFTAQNQNTKTTIDCNTWTKGIYFVNVNNERGRKVFKVVRE